MGISFKESKGSAVKGAEAYKYKDDENVVRLVGDILPRYVYWLKGKNNKDIPAECLSFDREKEKFTNAETDYVTQYFPDAKCQWAYAINCIDPATGKVVVLNLKKKLLQQIKDAAEELGDPTDPVEGWDIVFKRKKTGPLPFNVEYTLNTFKLKRRPLTEAEMAALAEAESIDTKMPRPTAEEIKALCERIKYGADDQEEAAASTATKEAVNELN